MYKYFVTLLNFNHIWGSGHTIYSHIKGIEKFVKNIHLLFFFSLNMKNLFDIKNGVFLYYGGGVRFLKKSARR